MGSGSGTNCIMYSTGNHWINGPCYEFNLLTMTRVINGHASGWIARIGIREIEWKNRWISGWIRWLVKWIWLAISACFQHRNIHLVFNTFDLPSYSSAINFVANANIAHIERFPSYIVSDTFPFLFASCPCVNSHGSLTGIGKTFEYDAYYFIIPCHYSISSDNFSLPHPPLVAATQSAIAASISKLQRVQCAADQILLTHFGTLSWTGNEYRYSPDNNQTN